MATYSKQLLSGGTNGKNIKVAATATAGTTIHTAIAGTTDITLTAEAGWVLVCPGLLLQNGLVVKAFAAAANVVNINGFVNRIDN